jgi:hypothetical protein
MMTRQRLTEIREQVTAATPNGPWWPNWESCGCEYCTHGRWIDSISGPTNDSYSEYPDDNSMKRDYGKTVSEIREFTPEAAHLVAAAPQIIGALLDEVERQRERAKFFERAAATATREINRMADEHEQCDISQEAP